MGDDVTSNRWMYLMSDRVYIPMLVVPVAAAGRLCVFATAPHVCCTAEDDHSVSRCHNTSWQVRLC